MKRVGYLAERVFTMDNVRSAWDAYNKNRPKKLRKEFNEELAYNILCEAKSDYSSLIGIPRTKEIREGGKMRNLEIPSFKSSIGMLMLWNICGKYVEKRIHNMSFSSRKGMGGHLAAKKCSRFIRTHRRESKVCLYFDIRKYYQHIDKTILLGRIKTIFKDKRIIEMFGIVLESTKVGLPIGYPFSHALANLYLVELYFLIRSIKGISKVFVYMDNWNILSKTKKAAHMALNTARGWLSTVGCSIKGDWQIFPTNSRRVKICGFELSPMKMGRLFKGIWRRTRRAFERYKENPTKKLYNSLMSRKGWLMGVNRQFSFAFKLDNGGYLWK